jgi:hypothetical protein
MANGRCRIHGGRSTGAKTEEGIGRIQEVNTTRGRTAKRAIEARRRSRQMARELKGCLTWPTSCTRNCRQSKASNTYITGVPDPLFPLLSQKAPSWNTGTGVTSKSLVAGNAAALFAAKAAGESANTICSVGLWAELSFLTSTCFELGVDVLRQYSLEAMSGFSE